MGKVEQGQVSGRLGEIVFALLLGAFKLKQFVIYVADLVFDSIEPLYLILDEYLPEWIVLCV